VRAVIAEDSGLLRTLLTGLLTSRGIDVVGETATGVESLRVLDTHPADVVVLDIRMPPAFSDEGLRAAEAIRARHPSVALLILSHYAETTYARRLLEFANRAVGYLIKDRVQDSDRLIESLHRVVAGEVVIDPEIVQQVLLRPRAANPLQRLSGGELRVLALMAEGRSNNAIARELNFVAGTVEKRITAIGQKLGLPHVDDPERTGVNIRVLAVLTYLRNAG